MGRPRRHGRRFVLSDETTWPRPDAELTTSVHRYGKVTVTAWHDLHPKLTAGGSGRTTTSRRSSRAASSGSRSSTCPNRPHGSRRHCGCGGPGRQPRPRSVLAGLPAPVRHRAHLPLRQGHPRLDHAVAVHPQQADRWTWLVIAAYTHSASLAASSTIFDCPGSPHRPEQTHPGASPQGVSATSCNPRHARQSTEIHDARPGTPKGHPKTTQNPLSRNQKGGLSRRLGLIAS